MAARLLVLRTDCCLAETVSMSLPAEVLAGEPLLVGSSPPTPVPELASTAARSPTVATEGVLGGTVPQAGTLSQARGLPAVTVGERTQAISVSPGLYPQGVLVV